MKKIILVFYSLSLLLFPVLSLAQPTNEVEAELLNVDEYIEEVVNNQNTEAMETVISPNMSPELKQSVLDSLQKHNSVKFSQYKVTFDKLADNKYKVNNKYDIDVEGNGNRNNNDHYSPQYF